MYDVLFIDDHFQEVEETFLTLKKSHFRCFYADGSDESFPSDEDAHLFKNVKYVCLDFFLENRGINESNLNKNSASALANVVKKFTKKIKQDYKIIIASAHISDFEQHEKAFKDYIGKVEIIKEGKRTKGENKFSNLHNNEVIFEEIRKNSIQNNLRNIVIREAIEIENAILKKIKKFRFIPSVGQNLNRASSQELEAQFRALKAKAKKDNFAEKIKIYNILYGYELAQKLECLRLLRNEVAHKIDLNKRQELTTKFIKCFDSGFKAEKTPSVGSVLLHIEALKERMDDA